jgi:riboflavin kinase/FMN adenylyltransferase
VKIYHSIEEFQSVKNAVVTTGTFDGVHVGHQKIISRLKDVARQVSGETVLLTFFPHPRMVLFSDSDLKLINTKNEKIKRLEEAGIDHLIIHPFSRAFSRLSSIEFVRDILVNKIGTKCLVIGYNHHFGRNREGSFQHLKEYGPLYGFDVEEISAQDVDETAVSSTKIRHALDSGQVNVAAEYLTRPFMLSGIVVRGNHLGRKIGFPTANITVLDAQKLIPAIGVYAVNVLVKETRYKGMLNIGVRPTIDGVQKTIEVHIFDFDQDVYGEEVSVEFMKWIRDERKFDSLEALKQQLVQDKKQILS